MGSDDSCGWFMRSRHCDQKILAKIASDFAYEWHRKFPYERFGWFMEDGTPNYSAHAIVLAMFRIAANHHYGHWSKAAKKFLNDNIFDILFFAENSCDSLCTSINQMHGSRDGNKEEQAMEFAQSVYSWLCRAERPWYRHPRWHFWHWCIQIHAWQRLKRRWWDKCSICGKRGFSDNDPAMGNWDGDKIWHESCGGSPNVVPYVPSEQSGPVRNSTNDIDTDT